MPILVGFALALVVACAHGHPGGLDGHGGHRGPDGYHFHRGPLVGQSFPSREEALAALDAGAATAGLRLASFNIRVFSDKSRDDWELDRITALLSEFDIVAVQEARDTRVLDRAIERLEDATGAGWRYEASPPVGRGVKEIYAFLYRSDRVLVKEPGRLVNDEDDRFIREPYYATFRAGLFDFTLLTIHALYKSKNAPEREAEFEALAMAFQRIQDDDPHEQDVILLGDFNDDSNHPRFQSIRAIPGLECLFQPPVKTTITDTSLYDNICFQSQHTTEHAGGSGIVMFDEDLFDNDDPAASRAVSDHRPVWAEFRMDADDD